MQSIETIKHWCRLLVDIVTHSTLLISSAFILIQNFLFLPLCLGTSDTCSLPWKDPGIWVGDVVCGILQCCEHVSSVVSLSGANFISDMKQTISKVESRGEIPAQMLFNNQDALWSYMDGWGWDFARLFYINEDSFLFFSFFLPLNSSQTWLKKGSFSFYFNHLFQT